MSEEGRKEKYLEIARTLKAMPRASINIITHQLGVSGKTVGDTRKLIKQGFIIYDEQGQPKLTVTLEEAEQFLDKYKANRFGRQPKFKHPETAEEAVVKAHLRGIAEEAEALHDQYTTLGRVIWTAYTNWAAKKGLDISRIREMPIDKAVTRALEKEAEYDKLKAEVEALKEQLAYWHMRADPMGRLEIGLEMFRRWMELCVNAKALRINLAGSPISAYYERQLERFLMGKVSE